MEKTDLKFQGEGVIVRGLGGVGMIDIWNYYFWSYL